LRLGAKGMDDKLKVAYMLHRFPYLTETFIMREMYWIREHGVQLHIFSLLDPKKDQPVHEQAQELMQHVRYSPFLSWDLLRAQLHFLFRSPARYFRALARTVWQTYREPGVLARVLLLFPKSVYFARQMEELGIEHIHAHFAWLEGIAAGVARDLVGITFTINPHAFDLFQRNQDDVRKELENATKVTTISEYHRQYIAELSPKIDAADVEIIHCGLEVDLFQPAPEERGRPVRILSIGRLIEKKGHEYLVDACALLAKRGLQFRCDIVGAGPLQGSLQERIDRHGLRDRVALLGPLDQEQILQLYRTTDIFALPAVIAASGDRDGIPVVLMEAMACELPVVTTAVTGIPELVQDGESGLIVAQRDASDLAQALERLIADPDLRPRLGKEGRRAVLEGFQVQDSAKKLASVFRSAIGRRQGSADRRLAA
jgi:colanic acid/amylovoran biosynthesis glycosyltransferase